MDKVSFIIPTYGEPELIEKCVNAINKNYSFDKEIIIVDDGFGIERNLHGVNYVVSDANYGFATSINKGVEIAIGNIICSINSDVFLHENCIENMINCLEFADIVGAKLLYPDGRIQHAGQAYMGNYQICHHTSDQPSRYIPVTGALMIMKLSTFLALGGFDENFFVAYEDVDFCFRAIMEEFKVYYCKQATATHIEGGTRGNSILTKKVKNPEAYKKEQKSLEYFKSKWSEPLIRQLLTPKY